MNERENPADEFEHAPKQPDENSAPAKSSDDSAEEQDLVTAYSRRSRRAAGAPSGEHLPPFRTTTPSVEAQQPEYRVRDFRPDPSAAEHGGGPDSDGRLSYQTQATPMAAPQTPPKAVVASVPPELAAPPQEMTRRELRELEARQGKRPQANDGPPSEPSVPRSASDVPTPAPAAPPPSAPAPPVPAPAPVPPPAAAAIAPPAFTKTEAEPAPPPVVHLAPPVPVPMPTPTAPPASEAVAPPSPSPEPVVFTDASGAPPVTGSPVVPLPVRQPSSAPQPTVGSLAINRGVDSAPEVFGAPDAHWQTQTNIDAANQAGGSFIRTVGSNSGALTTNALVIPSIPQASDITRPFSSTGEILVTGSIDLPTTLGSTGANPARFDHSDIDALFAQEDHDYAPADSAPVRAIRAVSTHTSTHGVISAKKPANNRLPMMMAVTAGILAVSVAALFAAALIFGYL